MLEQSKIVAVTGGNGYIASFIIADLLNSSYTVRTSIRNLKQSDAIRKRLSRAVEAHHLERLTFFKADLSDKLGWAEGFAGIAGIFHVASPLGTGKESKAQMIELAKGGTLRVLQAAVDSGVKRVIMTSSQAACTPRDKNKVAVYDETFWSDENDPNLDAYRLSKLHAEKAAWQFAKAHGLLLSTILPGAVFGPLLDKNQLSANAILLKLINGEIPRLVNLPFEVSHVNNLAILHRLAFENDLAIGERFLAADETISLAEIAHAFRFKFPQAHTPSKSMPDVVVKGLAPFVPSLKQISPMLGRKYAHTCEKARTQLGWHQYTPAETISQAAISFQKFGLIRTDG